MNKKFNKVKDKLNIVGNFVCAFIIFAIIIATVGIFVTVDANSKSVTGDYESKIFSYNTIGYTKAEVSAFGEKITIDFEQIDSVTNKIAQIAETSNKFTPSVFVLGGELIKNCLGSVGKIFSRIPNIVSYFYK